MSDTPNEPQPIDPPTNTGGGTTAQDPEDENAEALAIDPPVNAGGGGSA